MNYSPLYAICDMCKIMENVGKSNNFTCYFEIICAFILSFARKCIIL